MTGRGPTSLQFFGHLKWLDGAPLLDGIEPYRREIFTKALDTYRAADGTPAYNLVVSGRAKKNAKTLDLVLAALYVLVIRRSVQGSDAYILANDVDQAADDLSLAKKLVACNPDLAAEVETLSSELRLRDGSGSLRILPAKDVAGTHGKTFAFCGFDEIHAYKDWSLIEALAPDPTRTDALTWITSYASIYARAGAPLFDLMNIGRAGRDPRMLFSWYSGDYCTDPSFADLPPEERANPSMASWPDGSEYIFQQRTRLPFGRFRRLHLNLPGAPDGAAFDQGKVLAAVVSGRRSLPPNPECKYAAFVDMSGGSNDDAVLAIGHMEGRIAVVDLIVKQMGSPPFDPRSAVTRFCGLLAQYGIRRVHGDAYAGQTFRQDFLREGITYIVGGGRSASDLYESFEPKLNAGEVELLDQATLTEQLICLVWRAGKITHEPNGHDDHINAVAGLVQVLSGTPVVTVGPVLITASEVVGTSGSDAWRLFVGAEGNGLLTGHRRFDHPGGTVW